MQAVYLYPGSFCPPTYGHLSILSAAASLCNHVTVVCSRNPNKTNYWFTAEQCRKLWSAYVLPSNVAVETFGQRRYDRGNVVIVRGLRHERDFADESEVLALNRRLYGIDKYLHLLASERFAGISSRRAREAAKVTDLKVLATMVAPQVVTALLEKALGVKNLILVTGRPGGGKTTFCRLMAELNSRIAHINTDAFNHCLRPLINDAFPGQDLVELALDREHELLPVIADAWMRLAGEALRNAGGIDHILLESALAMKEPQFLYRFFGGKIICVDTTDRRINLERVIGRGTPEHIPFLDRIPDRAETEAIARRQRLHCTFVDSGGDLKTLRHSAEEFNQRLVDGGTV